MPRGFVRRLLVEGNVIEVGSVALAVEVGDTRVWKREQLVGGHRGLVVEGCLVFERRRHSHAQTVFRALLEGAPHVQRTLSFVRIYSLPLQVCRGLFQNKRIK